MQVVITHIYRLGAPKLDWTKKCGLTDCCQGAWQMSPAIWINKGYCCSVAKSCPTLCDPMDCSTPGIPVPHYLPQLAKTHVHWVRDAIWQSHLLSSPSLPAFNLAQHQGFSNESILRIRWPKYWSFSFSISPSNEYSGLTSFNYLFILMRKTGFNLFYFIL